MLVYRSTTSWKNCPQEATAEGYQKHHLFRYCHSKWGPWETHQCHHWWYGIRYWLATSTWPARWSTDCATVHWPTAHHPSPSSTHKSFTHWSSIQAEFIHISCSKSSPSRSKALVVLLLCPMLEAGSSCFRGNATNKLRYTCMIANEKWYHSIVTM